MRYLLSALFALILVAISVAHGSGMFIQLHPESAAAHEEIAVQYERLDKTDSVWTLERA